MEVRRVPPPWEKGELRKVRPLYRTWTGGFSGLRGGYKPHLRIYNFSGHLVSLRKGKGRIKLYLKSCLGPAKRPVGWGRDEGGRGTNCLLSEVAWQSMCFLYAHFPSCHDKSIITITGKRSRYGEETGLSPPPGPAPGLTVLPEGASHSPRRTTPKEPSPSFSSSRRSFSPMRQVRLCRGPSPAGPPEVGKVLQKVLWA